MDGMGSLQARNPVRAGGRPSANGVARPRHSRTLIVSIPGELEDRRLAPSSPLTQRAAASRKASSSFIIMLIHFFFDLSSCPPIPEHEVRRGGVVMGERLQGRLAVEGNGVCKMWDTSSLPRGGRILPPFCSSPYLTLTGGGEEEGEKTTTSDRELS
ncbi:hypothetical protein L249_1878 [Ophiocordyceps polyrhachis-furcata BCC 54312]|uniref:Uncharacterized protein n=1 Tax=Ophiocordyceps polyrhachis-furcata BCC 54312 TaxID=1330021 RepID=A0A367LPN8_9HYPO|nr:hypothetical protein L249_1878 [Ophiocordyceps polyrhachis-furcata BCC 54312]